MVGLVLLWLTNTHDIDTHTQLARVEKKKFYSLIDTGERLYIYTPSSTTIIAINTREQKIEILSPFFSNSENFLGPTKNKTILKKKKKGNLSLSITNGGCELYKGYYVVGGNRVELFNFNPVHYYN
jgi:hypothetical protein